MKPSENEALSRVLVNRLIEKSGWIITPEKRGGHANVKLEDRNINSEENKKISVTDYTFLDENDHPIMLLETKAGIYDPLIAKKQVKEYAKDRKINLVILSNGYKHYFWDLRFGNPEVITSIPSYTSLVDRKKNYSPKIKNFILETIDENFIANTQFPGFQNEIEFMDKNLKNDFIKNNQLKFLRKYQIKAINNLISDFKKGKSKFLFTMATGTGKTLLAASICKLFLKHSIAKRILFLVDRIELEKQAYNALRSYFKNEYKVQIFKTNKQAWNDSKILISTTQSLIYNKKYQKIFQPMDFDLIIVDEAHRSIINSSKELLDYFSVYKVGLTATPKNYLRNIDNLSTNPSEFEYRALKDTFHIFGCEDEIPTFNYSLIDGLKDNYLVNHFVIDARSPQVTSKLLSDKGLIKLIKKPDGTRETVIYKMNDYRKKYINIETDIAFIELFFKEAKKDPITNEIGKTIFFCVSQSHCRDITKLLNEYADKYYPGKYQSDFAEQVSSEIGHQAQDMAVDFSNNNLNGYSKFNDNYKTSKTRVCVTVGMMTTGYDCEDLLNICFLKPIVSPSDFIQYKGRGTRKHNFNENFITNINEEKIEKDNFFIFDFFGVFEFFENKFQYNKKIEIKNKGKDIFKNLTKSFTDRKFVDDLINPMSEINLMNFNKDVTKADKKNLETFEMFVKKNKEINENVQIENWEFIEEYIEKNYFQKNNINNSSLSKSLNLGRIPSTRELVELALDIIESIKSKDEIIDEEWSNFSSSLNFEANKYYKIKNFFEAYSSDYNFKKIIKEKNYKELISNNKFNYLDYKSIEQDLSKVIQYCDENLTIN